MEHEKALIALAPYLAEGVCPVNQEAVWDILCEHFKSIDLSEKIQEITGCGLYDSVKYMPIANTVLLLSGEFTTEYYLSIFSRGKSDNGMYPITIGGDKIIDKVNLFRRALGDI